MKLAEVEQKAREQHEADIEAAAQKEAAKELADQEARERFRQEVIAWMVQEGDLDAQELRATLFLGNVFDKLCLNVPKYRPITFTIKQKDGGFYVDRGLFRIEKPLYGMGRTHICHSLGEALLRAGELFQRDQQDEAESEQREADRQGRAERKRQEAVERGQHYLDMLDDHPMLRPILDILGLFLNEQERFAEDLYRAEEFAAGVEAQVGAKLEQARYEADRSARERDDLQRDLYGAQDKMRELERKDKRGC